MRLATVIAAETRCEALCRAARCSGKHGLQNNNALLNFYEKLVLFCKGAQENMPEIILNEGSVFNFFYHAGVEQGGGISKVLGFAFGNFS